MELPICMKVTGSDGKRKQHELCLKKSIYILNQASANWHSMLNKGLELRVFKESVADPCVFIKQSNKGGTSIFRNDVTNPPVKRGSVSVTNSKGGLRTFPYFNSSATSPTIKLVTETKSSAESASNIHEDTANKSSIVSTNKFWVKNFIESSLDVIFMVYIDDCIILSQDKKSIAIFIDTLMHGPERFAFTYEGSMDKYLSVDSERLPDNSGF